MMSPPLVLSERPQRIRLHPGLMLVIIVLMGDPLRAQGVPGMTMPSTDPVRSEIEVNRGIVDFEQNRFGEALERLSNAGPSETGASYYRGLSLLALKRAKEALAQFEAVGRKPGAPAEV